MMNSNEKPMAVRNLREIFRSMNPARAQQIREAYFKAVEGLDTLARSLEFADLEMGSPHDCLLIDEHLKVCEAIHAIKTSLIGCVV